jgi:hypothetical protein
MKDYKETKLLTLSRLSSEYMWSDLGRTDFKILKISDDHHDWISWVRQKLVCQISDSS